jgi:hypothetical protein
MSSILVMDVCKVEKALPTEESRKTTKYFLLGNINMGACFYCSQRMV